MNVVTLINRLADQDIRLWLQDGNLRYSAPDGAMSPDIIQQLRAEKAEIIRFLQQSEHSQDNRLPLADRSAPLVISHAQQRLWFIHRLDPANSAYHIHVALHIRGRLEAQYLQQACNEIIRRHEILRTSYVQQEGRVCQVIRPAFDYPIKAEPISAAELPDAIHNELHQAFALDGEIFRVRLWQMADTDFALSFTIHHIAADGWSLGIFVNELVQLYEAFSQGRTASLPALPCQYADYAFWQNSNAGQHEQQLQYWRHQLEGVANLSLPYDTPPSTHSGNEGAGVQVILEKAALERLQQLNKAQGSTLFMSLLAALSVLLQRYSQQHDFCIGTPIAGRSISQLEPLIGCFLNVLAMRCQPRAELTFSEYLQTIKTTCSEAFANQDVPFERIVQELVQERDLAISPLFQVMLSVQNAPLTAIRNIAGLDITPYSETAAAAQFDLKLTASEEDNRLVLLFEYRKTLFRVDTITQLAENFLTLLDNLGRTPDVPLHRIQLLTAARQQALLGLQAGAGNDTRSAWPEQDSVMHLFQRQVEQSPDAMAVSSPGCRLTYAQFNERVNRLAHYLLEEQQLAKPARVVICHKADADFLVAVYAILKAGACYIPVDPGYPDERIREIIDDAEAALVLTDNIQQQRLQLDSTPCLCITELAPALLHYSSSNPALAIEPDDAIYCIFTSGSTGKPKGVEVKHRGESNLIHWYIREFGFDHRDKCLVISAAGFDLTQKNFFAPLCSGGEVVLHGLDFYEPQAIARLIHEQQISVLNCAPSAFYPLIQDNDHSLTRSLRIVLLGGEPIRKEIVHNWLGATRFRCELVNMYGPTECTDIASIYRIRSDSDLQRNSIPIGRPIANTQLHILDDYRQLLPAGAIGELYIGGAGLAKGYVGNAALTAHSFIDNPFAGFGHPSARLYKTGDLVRYSNDGNIDYIGRTDQQIKIRGLRIEPGEIESRLQKIPGVRESLVIACKRPGTDNAVLLAYLVTDHASMDNAAIRHQLLLELPQYMIPAFFIALPAWPLSANGKIDRKALPQPDWNQLSQRPYTAPVTATQQTLAAIWSEVLGIEKIGIHDSFFELGGHSLNATQALSRAQESFAVEVPLRQIFENPTLEAIAALIDTALLEKTVFSNNSTTDEDSETFLL